MRTDHRPWPIPSKPWRMKQTWHDLLFAHWPIAVEDLERWIPQSLKVDLYDGQAWIGIVPFHMSGIRLRYLPEIPFTSKFAEINVRTYVTINNKPGVYFFSLDAANLLAVKAARFFYHLPYFNAKIEVKKLHDKIYYYSNRKGANNKLMFEASYRPVSVPFTSQQGTLEHWLTERYCLYSRRKDRLYRCNIVHEPWILQRAEADISNHSIVNIEGISLPHVQPLLHYSKRIEVLTWGLEEVE